MEKTRGYRELIVWQKAMDLIPQVYAITRLLPKEERYALTNQIQRAVISVAANIAEGQGRHHPKEFFRHLSIARGSLAELDTLLLAAVRLEYLTTDQAGPIEESMIAVRQLLQRLMQSIDASLRPTPDS